MSNETDTPRTDTEKPSPIKSILARGEELWRARLREKLEAMHEGWGDVANDAVEPMPRTQAVVDKSMREDEGEFLEEDLLKHSHALEEELAAATHERDLEAAANLQTRNEFQNYRDTMNDILGQTIKERDTALAQAAKMREALQAAYVNNQNMHCFSTKGRLNKQLNEQTVTLRAALTTKEEPK